MVVVICCCVLSCTFVVVDYCLMLLIDANGVAPCLLFGVCCLWSSWIVGCCPCFGVVEVCFLLVGCCRCLLLVVVICLLLLFSVWCWPCLVYSFVVRCVCSLFVVRCLLWVA